MSQLQEASPRAGASGASGSGPAPSASFYSHVITNSCRFTGSGVLSRTAGSPTNIDKFTISCWVKRSIMGTANNFVFGYTDNINYQKLAFNSTDKLELHEQRGAGDSNGVRTIDQVFRDAGAWYHIVWQYDTAQSTSTNREKFYVNGSQLSDVEGWDGDYPSQNRDSVFNKSGATIHIGSASSYYGSYFQGYMAEVVFCDGQAYAASDFGETKNGVWIPKDPSGLTFGSNGFYLKFNNASSMGTDSSGNGNNFTASNIGTHDQVQDTPSFGGTNGGNYPTYNFQTKGSYSDLSEGNLRADSNTGADASYPSGTHCFPTSGKWYYEQLIGNLNSSYPSTGLVSLGTEKLDSTRGYFYSMRLRSDNGNIEKNTGQISAVFGTITLNGTNSQSVGTGDIVGWYVDIDNKKAWVAKNGTVMNSGNPATGSNPQFSWTINPPDGFTFMSQEYQTSYTVVNLGQDGTFAGAKTAQGNADGNGYGDFYYAPPTGFLALCSGNVPMSAAIDPAETDDDYTQKLFNVWRYTGNNGQRTIDAGVKFDLLLPRSDTYSQDPYWLNTNRGIFGTNNYYTKSNSDGQEADLPQDNFVSQSNTEYVLSGGTWFNSGATPVLNFGWRLNGGTTAANNTGSVNCTQQVDPSGAFSISTYSGAGGTGNVGHGLNSAPQMVMIKQLNGDNDWVVYAKGAQDSGADFAYLNTNSVFQSATIFGNTAPSSTLVYLGDNNEVNHSGRTYIMYAWANIDGYIRSGMYKGNASTTGTFCYTGFEPAWLMVKYIGSGESWVVFNNNRGPFNPVNKNIRMNSNVAEASGSTYNIDWYSNGFRPVTTWEGLNGSNYRIIYLAFAKNYWKYSTAR